MIKVLVAPDSFKESASSLQVADAVERGLKRASDQIDVKKMPLADGGEGTIEVFKNFDGFESRLSAVYGPLGSQVNAYWVYNDEKKLAVIEMAAASGLELLAFEQRNPLKTSTYGTGELILHALDLGASKIILGIGGSATVDGGTGLARALGYRFFSEEGNELLGTEDIIKSAVRIDSQNVDQRLKNCKITVASDVKNPLLGDGGAAKVFAPQKGASLEQVNFLEKGLSRLADLWISHGFIDSVDVPGDGAAGGLGAGLRAFCNAEIFSGAELILDAVNFNQHLVDIDYIITGEGKSDSQTSNGKLCSAVALRAKERFIPTILISGQIDHSLDRSLFPISFSISHRPESLEEIMENTIVYLEDIAFSIGRLLITRK